jgi:predicted DNA-binding ribbon-helix-helix protein
MSIRRRGHMKSRVIKRTVYIGGRKTGVSVEDAFWSTLKEIADAEGAMVSQTVTVIDIRAQGDPCPPRSACTYSTGSVQKQWGSAQVIN